MRVLSRLLLAAAIAASAACGRMEQSSRARPGDGAVIYQSTILTMDARRPGAEALIVNDGVIVDVGAIDDLVQAYPGASFDERFLRRTLMPAFIDARLEPNALNVVEIPCQGGMTPEEFAALGSRGEQVRLIAGGPAALAAATVAAEGVSDRETLGRVTIEARGPVTAATVRILTALGVPLVLSGDALAEGCTAPTSAGQTSTPLLYGLIAIAPAGGETSLIGAASRYLGDGGAIQLSPQEALEAITIDAAFALGVETDRGVIAAGRRAVFAVLDRNPLATSAEAWGGIAVETVNLPPAE